LDLIEKLGVDIDMGRKLIGDGDTVDDGFDICDFVCDGLIG